MKRRPSIVRNLESFTPPPDDPLSRDRSGNTRAAHENLNSANTEAMAKQLFAARETQTLLGDVATVQWRKSPRVSEAYVAVDARGIVVLYNDKVLAMVHLLDVQNIVTTKASEVRFSSTLAG